MAHGKNGALIERINSTTTSAGTLNLANNSASFQIFTGTTTHTVVLPQADAASPNECPLGLKFVILNRSSDTVTVNAFGGGLLAEVSGGAQTTFRLTDKSTSAGSWDSTVEGGVSTGLSDIEKAAILTALSDAPYSDATTESRPIIVNPETIGGNYWLSVPVTLDQAKETDSFNLNGYLYTAGGWNGSTSRAVHRFSSDLNISLTRNILPFGRFEAVYFTISGTTYSGGGHNGTGTVQSGDGYKYSDVTNIWTAIAALSPPGHASISAVIDDRGYVAGGYDTVAAAYRTAIRRYDPTLNTYVTKSPSMQRGYAPSNMAGLDKIIYAGGTNGSVIGSTFTYSPDLDSILTESSMVSAKESSGGEMLGEYYAMSGYTGSYVTNSEKFNETTRTWSSIAPTATARFTGPCSSSVDSNGLFIFGGYNPSYISSIERYIGTSFISVPFTKLSLKNPVSIMASAAVTGVTTAIPLRIRANGEVWKSFMSGSAPLKGGPDIIGSELLTNGTFDTNLSGWTSGGGISTWSAGTVSFNRNNVPHAFYQIIPTTVGQRYRFSTDVVSISSGGLYVEIQAGTVLDTTHTTSITALQGLNTPGTYSVEFTATNVNTIIYYHMEEVAFAAGVIDNASVKTVGQIAETVTNKFRPTGEVYSAQGGNNAGNSALGSIEKLNSATNVWTTRNGTVYPAYNPASFSVDGYAYSVAGATSLGATSNGVATNNRYDDITDASISRTALPQALFLAFGYSILNTGYVPSGGDTATGAGVTTNYAYNPSLNSWSSKAKVPAQYVQNSGFAIVDRGYLTSGNTNSGGGQQAITHYYDPATDVWTSAASAPTSDRQVSGFGLFDFGYRTAGAISSDVATHKYDPRTNSWTTVASLSSGHAIAGSGAANGFGYVMSGGVTQATERYNPESNTWSSSGSLNVFRREATMGFTPGILYKYELQVGLPTYLSALGGAQWITRASQVTPHMFDTTFVLNGTKMYGVGGFDTITSGTTTRSPLLSVYNSTINSWYRGPDFAPGAGNTGGHSGCNSLYGRGYTVGWNSGASGLLGAHSYSYDGDTGTWTSITSLPVLSGSGNQNGVLNGLLYNNGNHPASGTQLMHVYDPSTNAWTAKTSSSNSNYGGASSVCTGHFHVYNGSNPSHEAYNDASNAWSSRTNAPSNLTSAGSSSYRDGSYLLASGYIGAPSSLAFEFFSGTNAWLTKQNMTVALATAYGARVGDTAVHAGGHNGSSYVTSTYEFLPAVKNIVIGAALKVNE